MKSTHDILLEFTQQVQRVLGKSLKKVILYGSYARGDYNENSDIDIMVLTTLTDEEIRQIKTTIYDVAFDFQMEYGVDISVILKNEDHFNYWLGALKQIREKSDYDDFFIASKAKAEEQIATAEMLLGEIKEYLKEEQ